MEQIYKKNKVMKQLAVVKYAKPNIKMVAIYCYSEK